MPLTAILEHTTDIPVAPGVSLYDVQVEAEIVSTDQTAGGFEVVAVSLDSLADIPKKGRRWSYVEIGRWHEGHKVPFAPTKLAWHLTRAIAKELQNSPGFIDKAREALGMERINSRIQAAFDRAAAE